MPSSIVSEAIKRAQAKLAQQQKEKQQQTAATSASGDGPEAVSEPAAPHEPTAPEAPAAPAASATAAPDVASAGDKKRRRSRFTNVEASAPQQNSAAAPAAGEGAPSAKRVRTGPQQEKIFVPTEEHPNVNWIGLLLGPRGSTQKRLEADSGCRMLIRGRGSQKNGSADNDPEAMHVLISGPSAEAVEKGKTLVQEILFDPEKALRLKDEQLRRLADMKNGGAAALNGGGTGSNMKPMQFNRLAGVEGAAGAAGGTEQQEIYVPGNSVGLIIGRGGENITSMETTTGCSVQVQQSSDMQPGQTDRRITLRGTPSQIEEAKKLIQYKISTDASGPSSSQGGGRGGPLLLHTKIPDHKAGSVIGRQGATIRSIQMRNRVHIDVPSRCDPADPQYRIVVISGHSDADLQAAKREIDLIISPGENPAGGAGPAALLPGHRSETMMIPDSQIGGIIGKGGETIRQLQQRTGANVQIPRREGNMDRQVTISGPDHAVQAAMAEIQHLMGGGGGMGHGHPGQYGMAGGYGQQHMGYGAGYGGGAAYGYNHHASAYGMQGGHHHAQAHSQQGQQASDQAEQWARFYERDPQQAAANGYTQQHYEAYQRQRQASGAPGTTSAAAATSQEATGGDAQAEQWARYYESNPEAAIASGYTKAHYEAYKAKAAAAGAPAGGADASSNASAGDSSASAAGGGSQGLTENDEQWARFYEKSPEEAKKNGYTEAHYESYRKRKAAAAK